MNYFEFYIGDYLRDTGELKLAEHGAYLLLMASYYSTEDGLPADKDSLYRITRAMKKDEQQATMRVAERFFHLGDDGRLHAERIDQDLHKANARIDAARENGRKGGRPAKPKANPEETQEKPTGLLLGSDPVNPDQKLNVTLEKAHHTPDPIQEQDQEQKAEARTQISTGAPTDAGRACVLMRQAGCPRTNPSDANLHAALAEGVKPEALGHTAAEAIEANARNPFAWAIATARSRHAQGASPVNGAKHEDRTTGRAGSAVERVRANVEAAARAADEQRGYDH